jgi:hypothetical protein
MQSKHKNLFMTIEEVYKVLRSKNYYQNKGSKKFRFINNDIYIDRRSIINFNVYKENESFYLNPDVAITEEKELRIEIKNTPDECIHFYGKINGQKLLTLE